MLTCLSLSEHIIDVLTALFSRKENCWQSSSEVLVAVAETWYYSLSGEMILAQKYDGYELGYQRKSTNWLEFITKQWKWLQELSCRKQWKSERVLILICFLRSVKTKRKERVLWSSANNWRLGNEQERYPGSADPVAYW